MPIGKGTLTNISKKLFSKLNSLRNVDASKGLYLKKAIIAKLKITR
jgi:hypothetical protein